MNRAPFYDKLQAEPRFKQKDRSGKSIQHIASSTLPTKFGAFTLHGFFYPPTNEEISAISIGAVKGGANIALRIHSACHTGDTLSSLRCDCQAQLHAAQKYIARKKSGVIVYLPQEGRGIGLVDKIKTYHLQDLGLDTAEANQFLGYESDLRDYTAAAQIIRWFKISTIQLITNNLDKVQQLQKHGITISNRIPLRVGQTKHNKRYLRIKKTKFNHQL